MTNWKTMAAVSAVAMATVLSAGSAEAAPVISLQGDGTFGDALSERSNFITANGLTTLWEEDFDDFATLSVSDHTPHQTITSNIVGTFESTASGQLGQKLRILDSSSTPFSGRFDADTSSNDGNWLDSNDSTGLEWVAETGFFFEALGFIITDVLDVAGTLTVIASDGTTTSTDFNFPGAGGNNPNGEAFFVSVTSFDNPPIASATLEFNSSANNDGYGIDAVVIGSTATTPTSVPEPATLAIVGAGLVGAGLMGRRRWKV